MAYINSLARIQIEVMMHRLFTAAALILLLISCQSTDPGNSYLEMAEGLYGEEAEALYSQALGETDNAAIYYNLAYSHLQQGEFREAAAVADEALAIYPDMIRFMYLKAYAYREAGMMRSYEEQLKAILGKDPANTMIRTLLADRYKVTLRTELAEQEARTILLYDHTNKDAISILAQNSSFYKAISSRETQQELPEWRHEPKLYDATRILNGEGLISQP